MTVVPPRIVVRHLAGPAAPRVTAAADGPVVVVGPSLGTSVARLWRSAAADLAAALPGARVVGWDLPGHGASPAARAPFGLADLARSVLTAVDEGAGSRASYLMAGDSVGGAVALQTALDHPDRVASVAMLCSAARFGTPEAWTERAALVRAQGMDPMVASSPGRWFGSRVRSFPPVEVRAVLADLAAVDPESYALVCEALAGYDARDRLAELSVPLLAVAGADDVVTPPSSHQVVAATVPHGRFAVLRGVGHLAPFEDPMRTASLLREHFAGAGRAVGAVGGKA